jgi:hypothetical protein
MLAAGVAGREASICDDERCLTDNLGKKRFR